MKGNVLIAGGSGTIGRQIYRHFKRRSYTVIILSRNKKLTSREDFIYWDPAKNEIKLDAPIDAIAVINLSGAGIMDKRWSPEYKTELINSRVKPIQFLDELIHQGKIKTNRFISVSAAGIYGDQKDQWCHESDIIDTKTFITKLCHDWEQAVLNMQSPVNKTILRMGIVLSADGGILQQYLPLLKMHMAPAFNKGRPFMPWVDVNDVADAIEFIINKDITGKYNLCADNPVTSKEFARTVLDTYLSWGVVRRIPNVILDLILGERSEMLKFSQRMSNELIQNKGFEFRYKKLVDSLRDLKEKEK